MALLICQPKTQRREALSKERASTPDHSSRPTIASSASRKLAGFRPLAVPQGFVISKNEYRHSCACHAVHGLFWRRRFLSREAAVRILPRFRNLRCLLLPAELHRPRLPIPQPFTKHMTVTSSWRKRRSLPSPDRPAALASRAARSRVMRGSRQFVKYVDSRIYRYSHYRPYHVYRPKC
jgi:hypothetical protein